MRDFTVVGRAGSSITPPVASPRSSRVARSRRPSSSAPTTPSSTGSAPSALRLAATFAAPPSVKLSRSISTTGTGASGEMRSTRPHR